MINKFSLILLLVSHALFGNNLELDQAVFFALTRSPSLSIAADQSHATHSLVKQAALIPNPVLSYEVEDFGGKNNWTGWDHREERYFYNQLFETAGKRHLRTEAAKYQYYATLVGYDVSKLIVLNRLTKAFIAVVASQEQVKLAEDQMVIANEMLRIATRKTEAGKVSIIQQNKAEVAASNTQIALERSKVALRNNKRRLSLLWGEPCPEFEEVIFEFHKIFPPKTFDQCLADLCNQAEVVQWQYSLLNTEKVWNLEKANGVPDITLQVGYKANYSENNQGLIAGISVPIPLFNRNQGNVGRAYYDMLKTGDQGRQLWILLESKLSISYEDLARAYDDAIKFKEQALPSAKQAFELAEKGYKEGKFEYLDVLDAQRTFFEVRLNYIQALSNYHTGQADIDYLNSQTD